MSYFIPEVDAIHWAIQRADAEKPRNERPILERNHLNTLENMRSTLQGDRHGARPYNDPSFQQTFSLERVP